MTTHCIIIRVLIQQKIQHFSIHVCLFTRGAIFLGIESAPLSEDEDENKHTIKNLAIAN